MFVDKSASIFECGWSYDEADSMSALSSLAEFQNQKLFFAQLMKVVYDPRDISMQLTVPLIRFLFVKPGNCGFKIVEVRSNGSWVAEF